MINKVFNCHENSHNAKEDHNSSKHRLHSLFKYNFFFLFDVKYDPDVFLRFCDIHLIVSLITCIIILNWVSFSSYGLDKISFIKSECSVPGILSKRMMSSLHCEYVGPCQTPLKDSSPHPSPFPNSHNSPLTHTRHNQTDALEPSAHTVLSYLLLFIQWQCSKHDFHIKLYHLIWSVHNFHSVFAFGRRVFRGCM